MKNVFFTFIVFCGITASLYSQCDTLRGYNVGANMNADLTLPFNNYTDYSIYHSDFVHLNNEFTTSSNIRILPMTTPFNLPKLHRNNQFASTYSDEKYLIPGFARILTHSPDVSSHILGGHMSGLNSRYPASRSGLILYSAARQHNQLLTFNTLGSTSLNSGFLYGDYILKTVEDNDYIYAAGFKVVDSILLSRIGILYRIDKKALMTNGSYSCDGKLGTSAIELFTHHHVISDIFLDKSNNRLYYCSGIEQSRVSTGQYGYFDLSTFSFNERTLSVWPVPPSPATVDPTLITSITKGRDGHNYGVFRMGLRLGMIQFDDALNPIFCCVFGIDLGPSSVPGSAFMDAFPTNIEARGDGYFLIGGLVKDLLCVPGAGMCQYRHFTLGYHKDSFIANSINNRVNIYLDHEYLDIDRDPFTRTGGAVNSASTRNKRSRTIALDASGDTLHITYPRLVSGQKNVLRSYKRAVDVYRNFPNLELCRNCFVGERPNMWVRNDFHNITSVDAVGLLTPEEYCLLEVETIDNHLYEEFPVTCDKPVLDGSVTCDFWDSIRIYSGSDTICKAPADTLAVSFRSPFGVNTFEWVNMRNPFAVLSTDYFLPISTHGTYRVICTRALSDGTKCSDTFFKTIKQAQDAWIESLSGANSICPGDELLLLAHPVLPSVPFYKYLWSNDSVKPFILINHPSKYYVTVTFLNGCKDVDSLEIYWASPTLTTSFNKVNGHALNESFTMTVTACNTTSTTYLPHPIKVNIPAGYKPTGLDPAWSQTTLSNGSTEISRPSMLGAGTVASPACVPYTITLRATNPCRGIFTSELHAFTAPCILNTRLDTLNRFRTLIPRVTPKSDTICLRDTLLLSVASGLSGGSETANYQWQRNFINIAGSNAASVKAYYRPTSLLDQYRALVSIGGCTAWSDTARIGFYDTVLLTHTTKVKKACFPIPDNNGRITVMATGGTKPYRYRINTNPYQKDSVFTKLKKGQYLITVIDTNGCTDTSTVFVDNLPPIARVIDSIVRYPGCNSDSFNGIVKVKNSNGNARFDSIFFTSLSGRDFRNRSSRIQINPNSTIPENPMDSLRSDLYAIRVIDTNGCIADTFVNLSSDTGMYVVVTQRYTCGNLKALEAIAYPTTATFTYTWKVRPPSTQPAFVGQVYVGGVTDLDLVLVVKNNATLCERILFMPWRPTSHEPIVTLSGTVITPATYVRRAVHVIGQTTLNANLTFKDCRIRFINSAGSNYGALRVNSGRTLDIDSSTLSTCTDTLAQGIVLLHNANLKMTNSTIDDMMRGIEFLQDANAELKGNRFGSNAIGIQLSHSQGRVAPLAPATASIIGNTFQPTGSIKPNAKQIPYGSAWILPSNSGSPVIASRSYAGIVSLASSVSLTSSPPTGYNLSLGHQTFNASEVNTFSNLFYGIAAQGGVVNVYHPSMSNMAQHIVNVSQPFPFPPIVGYANSYSYPSGSTPMEGTGILFYNTNPAQSPRSQLTVQGNSNFENFNGAVFRAVDVRDAHVTVHKTFMKSIYQGFNYRRDPSNNSMENVNFTENRIEDKIAANGDMASAFLYEEHPSTAVQKWTLFNVDKNYIQSAISGNNAGPMPVFVPGSGTPQALVHFKSSGLTSQGSPTSGRTFTMNYINNRGVSSTGVKFTGFNGVTGCNDNHAHLSDAVFPSLPSGTLSHIFRACFEYEGCTGIVENRNKATSSVSNIATTIGTATPSGSFPVGFNYRNTTNSTFSCNQALRGLSSSVLFEGACTNSFLINANLTANRYGIIIANNTAITVHDRRANKFYCGSHIVGATENHIWRGTNTGTGILFITRHQNASFTGCMNPAPGSVYPNNAGGYLLRPASISASVMTSNTVPPAASPEVPSCPILVPMPKMASASPVLKENGKSNDCSLAPNPASNSSSVTLDQPTEQTATVYVYDMMGRVVLEDQLASGSREYKVNLENLVNGMYQVVVIENKQTICTKRLVVDK